MDFEDLFEKYQKLLAENKTLKEENEALKAKLGLNVKEESDQDQGTVSNISLELVTQESPCNIAIKRNMHGKIKRTIELSILHI